MRSLTLLPVLLLLACSAPQDDAYDPALVAAFEARRDTLIDFFHHRTPPDDLTQGNYFDIAARLYRGEHLAWASARLDTLLQAPRGDMFWMYPVVTVMYTDRGQLSAATRTRLRDSWRTYMPYRGDTENHFVLYYASLYLAAQQYPDDPAETWFTGKSAQENMDEARGFLLHWMDLTTTIGQGEYDSPHYLRVFIAPMAMLYAWADDAGLRQRAGMMLDLLLADYAAESLGGLYAGAHSRIYEHEAIAPWANHNVLFSWLLFGEGQPQMRGEAFILAVSGYTPPAILHHIATNRSTPYVHRERKRTRHRIRGSDVRNAPVYKYTRMRPEYALGSSQGGLLQPIQQQTWDLTWKTPYNRDAHNTLFTLHPYSSPFEGTMYFAEPWHMVTELIIRSKRAYDSPDKWTGGSPYEQVVQHEDALIALYDLPEGTRFPHITGFFSRDLAFRDADASGWIFARGGDALIAYYPLAPYTWQQEEGGDWRLHSPHLKNGAVVQVAPAAAFPSAEAFKAAIRALPFEAMTAPRPRIRFTTLSGATLEATYGEPPRMDGAEVRYDRWPLYDGPFLQSDPERSRFVLRHGTSRRTLDFETLTVTSCSDCG